MRNFSRRGDPVQVPINADGSASQVDARAVSAGGPRPDDGRLFFVQNPNPFYVLFRGSSVQLNGQFRPASAGMGWLLPPHSSSEIFISQNPDWMSAKPVTKADVPAFDANGVPLYREPILVQYGT